MSTISLSADALALLRACVSGDSPPVEGNRDAYRELATAGVMYPVSGFVHGPEAIFRFTAAGWNRREEWLSAHAPHP